jgi:hypothetical protein
MQGAHFALLLIAPPGEVRVIASGTFGAEAHRILLGSAVDKAERPTDDDKKRDCKAAANGCRDRALRDSRDVDDDADPITRGVWLWGRFRA